MAAYDCSALVKDGRLRTVALTAVILQMEPSLDCIYVPERADEVRQLARNLRPNYRVVVSRNPDVMQEHDEIIVPGDV